MINLPIGVTEQCPRNTGFDSVAAGPAGRSRSARPLLESLPRSCIVLSEGKCPNPRPRGQQKVREDDPVSRQLAGLNHWAFAASLPGQRTLERDRRPRAFTSASGRLLIVTWMRTPSRARIPAALAGLALRIKRCCRYWAISEAAIVRAGPTHRRKLRRSMGPISATPFLKQQLTSRDVARVDR
jgi:hypothetical protein